ncbi:hypothetical protein ACTMU2_40115 [Cupriavidus basilensis]
MSQTVDYNTGRARPAACLPTGSAEDGQHAVCLLVRGPPDNHPWIHIPIGYGKTMFQAFMR